MKKYIVAIICIMLMLMLCACGEGAGASDSMHEITGSVVSIGDDEISIDCEGHETLTFKTKDAEFHLMGDAVTVDDLATVTYRGDIDGDDASGCKVLTVSDQSAEEKIIEGSIDSVNFKEGEITVLSGNTKLTFSVGTAERHYAQGVSEGTAVIIKYTGVIDGEDTSKTHVHYIVDKDHNLTVNSTEVDIETVEKTVWTTVPVNVRAGSSAATRKIAVLSKGTELTRTGIGSDGWSRVEYNDETYYIASQFLDTAEPVTDESAVGTVTDASLSDITILTDEDTPRYLKFAIPGGASIDFTGGSVWESTTCIEYTGKVDGKDTSAATLVHIYRVETPTEEDD